MSLAGEVATPTIRLLKLGPNSSSKARVKACDNSTFTVGRAGAEASSTDLVPVAFMVNTGLVPPLITKVSLFVPTVRFWANHSDEMVYLFPPDMVKSVFLVGYTASLPLPSRILLKEKSLPFKVTVISLGLARSKFTWPGDSQPWLGSGSLVVWLLSMDGGMVTVKVAGLEVTELSILVTTTRYRLPLMAVVTPVKFRVEDVAPSTLAQPSPLFTSHWNVGAGVPAATTVNVALPPACTLWFVGWVVMVGATFPAAIFILKVLVQFVDAVAPFTTVALTVTVPADVAVKTLLFAPLKAEAVPPWVSTVHRTFRLVAFPGLASSGKVIAVLDVPDVGTPVMPVTGTNAAVQGLIVTAVWGLGLWFAVSA